MRPWIVCTSVTICRSFLFALMQSTFVFHEGLCNANKKKIGTTLPAPVGSLGYIIYTQQSFVWCISLFFSRSFVNFRLNKQCHIDCRGLQSSCWGESSGKAHLCNSHWTERIYTWFCHFLSWRVKRIKGPHTPWRGLLFAAFSHRQRFHAIYSYKRMDRCRRPSVQFDVREISHHPELFRQSWAAARTASWTRSIFYH